MALEQPGMSIGFLKAAAAMTSNQFKCVKVTADATFNLATAAGENIIGILQDAPASGSAGNIMVTGISKVLVGTGDLAAGANWETAADGTAITAATGKVTNGTVLIGAVAGKLATVTVLASAGGTVA